MNSATRETFDIFVKRLDAEASKTVAEVARKGRLEITGQQTRRGVPPDSIAAVDGKRDVPFENVKPEGQIFIAFDYRLEAIKAAFDELRARSPFGPPEGGHYRDEHFVMLDGAGLRPLELPAPEQLRSVRVITITNPMPYARKLEVRQGLAIFEGAMRAVRIEFGKVIKFRFAFVSLASAYTLKRDHVSRTGRTASRDHRAGAEIQYPAILMEAL